MQNNLLLPHRREMLKLLGLAAAIPSASAHDPQPPSAAEYITRLNAFFGETEERPKFVWLNREDVFYHDEKYPPGLIDSPEFNCLQHKAWVFNRTMEWVRESGTILCFENGGSLQLTGDKQVSQWFTGTPNKLYPDGAAHVFQKGSHRWRDTAILPAFQFQRSQHKVLRLQVLEANTDWQFVVGIKGRCGPPLVASAWHSGPANLEFDLSAALARNGFHWNYPELYFVIGTWNEDESHASRIRFSATMPCQAAVVPCLPVVRTETRAKSEGIPITAVVVDDNGRRISGTRTNLTASVNGVAYPMQESNGVFRATIRGLREGDYTATLSCSGAINETSEAALRVTSGEFYTFEKQTGLFARQGRVIGPLSGSFQGTFYFRNAGLPGENLVQGQAEWDAWDRSPLDSERMHYWEALKADELNERFAYLKDCGWDTVALHSHWGSWEKLDAGGRISPHAAEQLAVYYQVADRHGLSCVQGLNSGPYAHPDDRVPYGGTPTYSRYVEEGFSSWKHFMNVGSNPRFEALYHQYLSDFAALFSDETGLMAMTADGEGDHYVGAGRVNDTMDVIRRTDKSHLFLAETILSTEKLPRRHSIGFRQDLFGGRSYHIANRILPEEDLSLEYKAYSLDGAYMAEGSWPPMPEHIRLHRDVFRDGNYGATAWTGNRIYRLRMRDTLYLGLVHRNPMFNSWDEMVSEDEHTMFRTIREQVDWRTAFAPAPIAVLVDDATVKNNSAARKELAKYAKAFSRMGIAWRFAAVEDGAPADAAAVIDGRAPFQSPKFRSEGGLLPDELKSQLPITLQGRYAVSYLQSADRRTLLAYIYNVSAHRTEHVFIGGNFHRYPVQVPLRIALRGSSSGAGSLARLYDLETKTLLSQRDSRSGAEFDLGLTSHDYFLLVRAE